VSEFRIQSPVSPLLLRPRSDAQGLGPSRLGLGPSRLGLDHAALLPSVAAVSPDRAALPPPLLRPCLLTAPLCLCRSKARSRPQQTGGTGNLGSPLHIPTNRACGAAVGDQPQHTEDRAALLRMQTGTRVSTRCVHGKLRFRKSDAHPMRSILRHLSTSAFRGRLSVGLEELGAPQQGRALASIHWSGGDQQAGPVDASFLAGVPWV
jgi:hypothetical protein